jgi:hypothetical protein
MNPIGGYFELELRKGKEFHNNAIRLNTGRNALELILKVKKYKKVFIPYYTCDVILEPFKKLGIEYEFYSINATFEPLFDYNTVKNNEGFLYINYFGLKGSFISKLIGKCKNLIIDNSQAFFTFPILGIPTFYSCRKFFGVADGAYLYLDDVNTSDMKIDVSLDRVDHLLRRIETGAESGFNDFKNNEYNLIGQPILLMSNLTKSLLNSIDYEAIKKIRRENYFFLNDHLSGLNKLDLSFSEECVPMIYPFLSDIIDLKHKLIENKIFVATYWPNVIRWTNKNSIEYRFASAIIHLPVDQRYSKYEMNLLVKVLEKVVDGKMD